MKRIWLFCIVLCLMMTGCSHTGSSWQSPESEMEQEDSNLSQTVEKTEEADSTLSQTTDKTERAESTEENETEKPKEDTAEMTDLSAKDLPDGAFASNYDGPEDRGYRAIIYGTTAYYECDPYNRVPWQPHIYSVPLGGETATDLLKGELIALVGSVLIGKTDTYFCAMDLSVASPKWVTLLPDAEYITHLQIDDTLCLYIREGEKYFADVIDLKTLKAERMTAASGMRQVTAIGDQIFYLTADGFYRGDPLKRSAVKLCTATEEDQLYLADDRIFIYRECTLPRVYNAKTQTVAIPELLKNKITSIHGPYPDIPATTKTEDIPLNSYYETPTYTKLYDGIVMIKYYDDFILSTLYYDIAADQEITDIEALYPEYTKASVADGGYLLGENNYLHEYYVNGKKYSATHPELYGTKQKHYVHLSESGAVHLYGGAVITVNFQTGQCAVTHHREQKVTQE